MHREPPPRPGWSWPRRSPLTWPHSAAPWFGNPEENSICINSQRWIMAKICMLNHIMMQETLRWWHLRKWWRRRRWWWWWWWRRWWWWWWWRWWWQWPFQFQWLPGRVDRASASTPHLPSHPRKSLEKKGKYFSRKWIGASSSQRKFIKVRFQSLVSDRLMPDCQLLIFHRILSGVSWVRLCGLLVYNTYRYSPIAGLNSICSTIWLFRARCDCSIKSKWFFCH